MSNDMMKVGANGAIFCMLAVVAEIVAIAILWISPIDYAFAGPHIDLGSGIGWAVGLVLLSIGIFGVWKQYKDNFAFKVGIFGMVVMAVGLILRIITWYYFYAVTSISWIRTGAGLLGLTGVCGLLWLVLNGVFLLLLGINLIKLKEKTGIRTATLFTGCFTIIAGAAYIAVIPFGYLVTQVLTLTVTVFLIYLFFKAK
jgi:hypothetical protein